MHLLALARMDPAWQAVCYGLAALCFLLATFAGTSIPTGKINLVALGLLFAVIVFFWQALAAA